jgi:F-type H+-transporting ATPase subunit delta
MTTNGKSNSLVRPYAQAAFEYALAENDVPAWESMLHFAAAIAMDARVTPWLHNPRVQGGQALDFFRAMLSDVLNPAKENFIHILSENKRLSLLPDLAIAFAEKRAALDKSVSVEVISALALSAEQQEKVKLALQRKVNQVVEMQVSVDPTLIGGLIVKMQDKVIDGSVRNNLNRLSEFI